MQTLSLPCGKKCPIQISESRDHELLELKKWEDNICRELPEIINKIPEFEKFVAPCGDSVYEIWRRVTAMRNNCARATDKYFHDLSNAAFHRDISEKKLNNAAALTIQLSSKTLWI